MTEYVLNITTKPLPFFWPPCNNDTRIYDFKVDKKGNVLIKYKRCCSIAYHTCVSSCYHKICEINDNVPFPEVAIAILNIFICQVKDFDTLRDIAKTFEELKKTLREDKDTQILKMYKDTEQIKNIDISLPYCISLEEEVDNLKEQQQMLKQEIMKLKQQKS